MKIALISDIHGNLPALDVVLEDIMKQNIKTVYSLGDLVNFAGWDNEVIDYIRKNRVACVQGNHDEGIGHSRSSFPYTANTPQERSFGEQSISWVNKHITDINRIFLKDLPILLYSEYKTDFGLLRITMIHNNTLLDGKFPLISDILIVGHTHIPYHKIIETEINGRKAYRHIVNVGSVGKSRLKDNRAVYCIMDIDTDRDILTSPSSIDIKFIHLPYNTEAVISKIREMGLPDTYDNFLSNLK